ncbi:hypothetical protein [Brevibacillus laterosporus]|uniref:Uncharacterized protein n=1 Tax=Brevibacillus laterosporus TaxID=1465 RepID=A0AAP3DD46_BRELA|nr:hypothetical protein [Brevibacillus laterosporus]MCR8978998.1 hypothetical protein [Brevibacillus laterosporus]MCZ0806154.1 hypothetical protein [Brevibacillus laterosporus]MCZ0824600.1 hypothetical protein [Brevibacillus laterosporus]MCZ0848632.1 hypothetical protein [Brevibacillus laterosporus]MED1666532.1 hypothetical protein [Brevibacillus laterosporus]
MKKHLSILSLTVIMSLGLLRVNTLSVQENAGLIKQMSDQIGI